MEARKQGGATPIVVGLNLFTDPTEWVGLHSAEVWQCGNVTAFQSRLWQSVEFLWGGEDAGVGQRVQIQLHLR